MSEAQTFAKQNNYFYRTILKPWNLGKYSTAEWDLVLPLINAKFKKRDKHIF